jgi:sRNA-binding carbon storage regulator CsrA
MNVTRTAGESLRLGKDIFITVINNRNGTVCLAIDTPAEIPVRADRFTILEDKKIDSL